jgi:hypothetical protein
MDAYMIDLQYLQNPKDSIFGAEGVQPAFDDMFAKTTCEERA